MLWFRADMPHITLGFIFKFKWVLLLWRLWKRVDHEMFIMSPDQIQNTISAFPAKGTVITSLSLTMYVTKWGCMKDKLKQSEYKSSYESWLKNSRSNNWLLLVHTLRLKGTQAAKHLKTKSLGKEA